MAIDTVTPLRALSIRQPWAHAILHAGKDIENRPKPTNIRGRILIHASGYKNLDDLDDDAHTIMDITAQLGYGPIAVPCYQDSLCSIRGVMTPIKALQLGGIIGSVEIVDCVQQSKSPWFFGEYGYVLRNPKILPFWPCKGQLGFFTRDWPKELL